MWGNFGSACSIKPCVQDFVVGESRPSAVVSLSLSGVGGGRTRGGSESTPGQESLILQPNLPKQLGMFLMR